MFVRILENSNNIKTLKSMVFGLVEMIVQLDFFFCSRLKALVRSSVGLLRMIYL